MVGRLEGAEVVGLAVGLKVTQSPQDFAQHFSPPIPFFRHQYPPQPWWLYRLRSLLEHLFSFMYDEHWRVPPSKFQGAESTTRATPSQSQGVGEAVGWVVGVTVGECDGFGVGEEEGSGHSPQVLAQHFSPPTPFRSHQYPPANAAESEIRL